jgi:1-acyl-sn-glycerol-3-phosphate acyltransferase
VSNGPRSGSGTLKRRFQTVPILVTVLIVLVVTAPVVLPIALGIDAGRWLLKRTPFMATRILLFGLAYATLEVVGLILLTLAWMVSGAGMARGRLEASTFRVQMWWASSVLASVKRIFGITLEAQGLDQFEDTPFILLARHTSIVDNLLPSHFISKPHGIHLAYVMKSELQVDPCLDVAGNRLPNVFVRRGAGETDGEVAAIRRLGSRLGNGEGVLIYPEGTRFNPSKIAPLVRRLERRNPDLHAIARNYRTVLPPRPAGTLALLDSTIGDVVVMAHRGLDGFARIADIWRGGMVRQRVEVLFWRIRRSAIPEERGARLQWLYCVWDDIDRWVADNVQPSTS